MAASNTVLGQLHEIVAKTLIEMMEGTTVEYTDPETGETTVRKLPPSAAEVQAAAKFLKDNNITGVAEKGTALGSLKEKYEKMAQEREQKRKQFSDALAKDDLGMFKDMNVNV